MTAARPCPARLLCRLWLCLGLAVAGLAAGAQEAYFTTDTLNPGLSPGPPLLDRSTPMAAMEAFTFYIDRQDYAAAAHLLDLSELPADMQGDEGARRARALGVIFERKVLIPWDNLADRPDGWLTGAQENPATGRVRRSILVERMPLGDHAVPIRLNRVKPGENADPVWVFSRQSVDNIPRLHAQYGPTALEQALPGWLRTKAVWNMYLWELVFLPLLLVLALVCAGAVFRLLTRAGRADSYGSWVLFAGHALRWPATIAFFAAIVGIGTRSVLVVSGLVEAVLNPLIVIAYVVAATLAIVLVIDEIFDRISKNDPQALADPGNSAHRSMATTITAARKFIIVIAVIAGLGIVLSSVNAMASLGLSLLASAGALTIVLGFAARTVLGNILASVQIALNRSARIGDQLIFEGHYCTVERIEFTYVQLAIWNGTRLIVPVSYFVADAFENWSIEDPAMVRPITLTLAQTADVDTLRGAFARIVAEEDDADVSPKADARVLITGQDVFGIKVRFDLPTPNPATGWDTECRVREKLLDAARDLDGGAGGPVLPPPPSDRPDT